MTHFPYIYLDRLIPKLKLTFHSKVNIVHVPKNIGHMI